MRNILFAVDSERLEFLRQLEGAPTVAVTDWESDFLNSATRCHTGAILFSEKQRAVIDQLFQKYADKVYLS